MARLYILLKRNNLKLPKHNLQYNILLTNGDIEWNNPDLNFGFGLNQLYDFQWVA